MARFALPVRPLVSLLLVLASASSLATAQTVKTSPSELLQAVERGDTNRLRMLLGACDANAANEKGETALMLAARAGSFEMCRALLWSGADANLTDKAGRRARDYLKHSVAGFTAVNLLLRSYAFVQQHHTEAPKIERPNLVIISDAYIDHNHKALKARYWVNEAEAKGKAGEDDDGNGFIDDVYGWNAEDDEPLRAPEFANIANDLDASLLEKFVALRNRSEGGDDAPGKWKDLNFETLRGQYENPLVRQLGVENLQSGGFDLDDFAFTKMLVSASHGTHVAGIVLKSSEGRALLHGMTHGQFHTPKLTAADLVERAHKLASRTVSYEQFLVQLRQGLVDESRAHGQRRSAYLRSTGAGVVNMSWSQSKGAFVRAAARVKDIYESEGMDPKSIEHYACPIGLDLCGDLGLEMLVAAAAEFALMIHENPDVLFVVAAGNETENNDEELPSPAYLSRFFPNVITVASVDSVNDLSEFSNFGLASVQVAAPGEKIRSSFLANQEGLMSGTSMAAPAVAGLAARLRAEWPHLTASDLRIILERSVTKEDSLEGKIASGGVVDPEAAMELAKQWQPGSRADLTLAAITAPKTDATPKDKDVPEDDEDAHLPGAISVSADAKGQRISSIGGFADQWRVTMSEGTGFKAQEVSPMGALPVPWIKSRWNEGWEITSIGGEKNKWRVVMSQGQSRQQKLVGLDFDTTSLNQQLSNGFRITNVAGYGSDWVFVLTASTSWGDQEYTLPVPINDERRAWITERLKQGSRITSLAGDNNSKDTTKGWWVLVMTKNSRLGPQVFTGPAAWPTDWIAQHEEEGYRVTQSSGFADHWFVVMTQDTKLGPQTISEGKAWNDEWVKGLWHGE